MPDDSGLAAVLLQLAGFSKRLAALESRPASAESGVYEIQPPMHWWSVDPAGRDKAIGRLRAWVEHVYRPYYGHLAVMLGDCWEQHPLCLVQLDWLSELHSYLYFSERTQLVLAAQAEYGIRIVPMISGQLHKETAECDHRKKTGGAGTWRSTA